MNRYRVFAVTVVMIVLLGALGKNWLKKQPGMAKSPVGSDATWFRDATTELGLTFTLEPDPQESANFYMPTSVGSGAAAIDFDNDGRLDLVLLQNVSAGSKSHNKLYHQEQDGRFTDVSQGSGLDFAGPCMGAAVGDINNDGWPDLLITEYGRMRLFRNNRDQTFSDITAAAGVENSNWGTSAAFVDYDRDGWLDLIVVNYVHYVHGKECQDGRNRTVFCPPHNFDETSSRLYRNSSRRGDGQPPEIRFDDVSDSSGVGRLVGPGLGVVCADFNGDHWPDIFIANDGKPNHLWINQQNGTFEEQGLLRGVAHCATGQNMANMGISLGDLDGDGLFEVVITHDPQELSVCYKQISNGMFQDTTARMGLAVPHWRATGWGTAFGDFDQDGALDFAVVNGAHALRDEIVPDPAAGFWGQFAERNQLFANDGKGRLHDISDNDAFCLSAGVGRGLVCADFDNDGSLDLLVTRIGSSARLYRNVAPHRGHWLMIRAVDPALGGRDSYGAEIVVSGGGRRWSRQINPAYSYLCSNDPRAHFGLGDVDQIESIEITWPDGSVESMNVMGVDRLITVEKRATGAD